MEGIGARYELICAPAALRVPLTLCRSLEKIDNSDGSHRDASSMWTAG